MNDREDIIDLPTLNSIRRAISVQQTMGLEQPESRLSRFIEFRELFHQPFESQQPFQTVGLGFYLPVLPTRYSLWSGIEKLCDFSGLDAGSFPDLVESICYRGCHGNDPLLELFSV
jgi:hypothetical protein